MELVKNIYQWRDAKKEIPPFNTKILSLIVSRTKNKGDEAVTVTTHYEIVELNSVIVTSEGSKPEWRNSDYDTVFIDYWCYMPEPPNENTPL